MRSNKMAVRITGGAFALIGLFFSVMLLLPLQFEHNPFKWFTPSYYSQFIPLYTAITLLLAGLFTLSNFNQANFYLAVFGHTASEEILFSWVGLTTTQLPTSAIVTFFPLSILALWIAYCNVLKQKKLSTIEAILGFAMSTALILIPRYW